MTLPADAFVHLTRAPIMQNAIELIPRYFIQPIIIPSPPQSAKLDDHQNTLYCQWIQHLGSNGLAHWSRHTSHVQITPTKSVRVGFSHLGQRLIGAAAVVLGTVGEEPVDNHSDDGEEEDNQAPEQLVNGRAVGL